MGGCDAVSDRARDDGAARPVGSDGKAFADHVGPVVHGLEPDSGRPGGIRGAGRWGGVHALLQPLRQPDAVVADA